MTRAQQGMQAGQSVGALFAQEPSKPHGAQDSSVTGGADHEGGQSVECVCVCVCAAIVGMSRW